ncbi:hypothetical protein [Palleronia sp. LCG004]|uniref:hypothetical protein n=1 Tax=Palleronia sp. LCG004 TaxID=3079304 RepID=UPI002943182A|nr:hypothetical protein [Palleronia sp. LCG004]WOI58400.1 hypothetical protein RVY76_18635 [Palleronia sp. LCG004]
MARIGFHGFKAGTAVELVLHKFGRMIPASTESWSAPDIADPEAEDPSADSWDVLPATATVEVTTWRSDMQVGPEGFYFKVTGYDGFDTPGPAAGETYDRRYHELVYIWDFDDPGARWTHPVNVMEHQRDANVGYGPQVGHTYTKPGTYSPSVIVYEPSTGKLAKHELGPFTVQDPDVVFAGAGTIYAHPTGDFSAAPSGAKTFTSIYDALNATRSGVPTRVMLAAGQEFVMPGEYRFENGVRQYLRNVYVCSAPGGRAKVTTEKQSGELFYMIDKSPRLDPSHGLDMTFVGIDVIGSWDASRETGGRARAFTFSRGGNPLNKAQYLHLHDVIVSGFDAGILYLGNSHQEIEDHEFTSILSNTTITNWGDYGIFSSSIRMALLGVRMTQHDDAMSGGWKNGAHNQHGCMRMNGVDHAVMDGCDFFTYNGWWQNIEPYHTQQPVLRWNFMGHDDTHEMELNMQRCSCEGGETILAFQHMNTGKSVRNQNAVIEGSILVGSHMTSVPIKIAFGGVSVRNNVFVFPDSPRANFHLFEPKSAGAFINSGLVTGDEIDPILWEHNTLVNLMSAKNLSANNWSPEGVTFLREDEVNKPLAEGTITENNNIVHQPNLATPQILYAPLDTTSVWEARTAGYRDGGGGGITLAADVPTGGSVEIPHKEAADVGQSPSAYANGQHFVKVQASLPDRIVSRTGQVDIKFTASSAVITNKTGVTWPAKTLIEYKWDRSRGDNPVQRETRLGTPKGSVATFAPLEGSKALGAGSEDTRVVLDFYGKRRPAYPSLGALECPR